VARLLASVEASPLQGSDGRQLGADALVTAIIYPLYSPESWTYLSDMFETVMFGEADTALFFADGYNGRQEDGTYRDNSTEAFRAINCLDYTYDADPATMRDDAAERVARCERRRACADHRRGSRADPRRRHDGRPRDAVRVGGLARRPARERRARELRRRGPHRVPQVERVRRHRRRGLPHRRHRARERPPVLSAVPAPAGVVAGVVMSAPKTR
jgi:hypothetical protein